VTRVGLLYVIAGALAVPALVLPAIPTTRPDTGGRLALPDPAPAVTGGRAPRSYAAIVAGDPFSVRRTPPSVRFVPVGGAHHSASTAVRREGPKLYGITLGPEGAVAVISADPGVRRAQLYEIGDTLAGARVVAISESTVTLIKPNGPLVLHLEFAGQRQP
jgi:hypothetical protein